MKGLMKSIHRSTRLFCRGVIVAALFTSGVVIAGEDATTSPTTQGSGAAKLQGTEVTTFIKEASQANTAEVALGQLAERKSQNADVKQFAQMMVKDHRAANEQLRPIAQAHNVAMSDTLDTTHQKKLESLQKLNGTEFDQQFMKDMLKGHQKVIGQFEKAAQQTQALDVKEYAQNTLPTLRNHMHHAKQTAQAVGIDQTTITSILKESSGAMGRPGEDTWKESGGAIKPDSGTKPDQQNPA